MDKIFEKIISDFQKINLSADEKSALKDRIISSINIQAIRQERGQKEFSVWSFFANPRLSVSFAALAIFILSGGGVMAGASRALPGDFLYPIKTEVNERLAGVFDFSEIAKASREVRLVDRRLQETQAVIASGRLSPEAREVVERKLERHVEKITSYVGALEEKGHFDKVAVLQDQLEISLLANEKIVSSLEVVVGAVAPVAPRAKDDLNSIAKRRTVAPEVEISGMEVDLSATAQGRALRAGRALEEAEILFKQQKVLDENFQRRLSQLKSDFEEGLVLLEIKSNREAIDVFDSVFRSASELRLLLEASQKLPVKIEFGDIRDDDLGVIETEPVRGLEILPVMPGTVRGEFRSGNIATTSSPSPKNILPSVEAVNLRNNTNR